MRYRSALLYTTLAVATALFAVPGPATAAVPGFQVQITELPGQFAVGRNPSTVTVVASTDTAGRCQKVRFSMLLTVNGLTLDQVDVERVEDSGSFPLSVQSDGDTARLTDRQVDPGELCRGRTVTAQYRMSFAREVTDGEVTLQAEAYDTRERLLELATATRQVVNGDAAEPTPSAPAESAAAGENPSEQGTGAGGAIAAEPADADASQSLLGTGLIVGAVLMFLGVGLLMRLRARTRRTGRATAGQPFYPAMW